ncbi:MAG: signal peptidase I [Patescibacteria group bacterium]
MNPLETPKKESFLKEIVKFTLIAVAIVIPVRLFIAQPFIVSGASMDPTFSTGQYLIVDQVSYRFEDPSRDDVIIFKYPRDPETFFIKRIIGLPGETLEVEDGQITIKNTENPEGFVLDESFISEKHKTYETFTVTLADDEYFVMGDNRSQSSDSRAWGPLEEKYIVGRPLVRLLPVSKVSVFPGR